MYESISFQATLSTRTSLVLDRVSPAAEGTISCEASVISEPSFQAKKGHLRPNTNLRLTLNMRILHLLKQRRSINQRRWVGLALFVAIHATLIS